MNAVDCLQYYENFYDSFCSEFAIPRAHTSQSSSSRPSSCNNLQIQDFNRNNGKLSDNHFYYFDTFSHLSPHQADEDETHQLTEYTPQIHPRFFYHECSDNDPLNEFNEAHFGQPFSMSLDQLQPFKRKGPTPPPKQRKIKQILDYHPPPLPPSDDGKSQSIPDFFQTMDATEQFMLRPSGQDEPDCTTGRYFHQSFESIASCPVPPPPKHVRAPQARHMSVERLPSHENNPTLSEKNQRKNSSKRREPMSLSDFLKLTSNNVFKKPPFSSKLQSSPPLLPCGHINNASDNATSSTPASVSSSGEGGIKQSRSQDGGRHSVLTFKKKCGVTKRRKKIDESLFKPTTSKDKTNDVLGGAPGSSQENNNNSHISIFGNPNGTTIMPGAEVESSQYSITNNPAADDATSPIMILAEINNDTEFELDPLPEKDSDDVLDFSWTLSPVMGPDDMEDGNSRAIVHRKNSRRKPSNSSTTGAGEGNGRPSSRCSLIINSLMGHISGLTKTTQEQPQESHPYQCSSKNNSCCNHNFAHHLDHRHNHQGRDDDHHHHHPSVQEENGDHHHNPSRVKFGHRSGHVGQASQEIGKSEQKKTYSDNFIPTAVTTNTCNITSRNNHRSPHRRMTVDLNPTNGNGYTVTDGGQLKRANNKIDSQRRRSDLLLTSSSPKECNPFHQAIQQKETGAHSPFIRNRTAYNMRIRPRSIAAFNLDIDAILPLDDNHNQHAQEQQCQSRKYSYYYPQCDAGSLHTANSGSKSLSNINFANGSDLPCENDDVENIHHHKSGHSARYPHGETRDDSFPGFRNVFGCIPRVSLSHAKTRQRDDAFLHYQQQQQLKPQFAVGGSNINTVTNNSHRHHHQKQPDQNYHTFHETGMTQQVEIHQQHPQRRRNCSGLFCQDDDCYDDHDEDIDKYDKYYGQYSLTGLNIPMLAANAAASSSSQKPQHFKNNVITAAKSAEELVLDRYYAHCNKTVQNNPDYPPSPPPPHFMEKENKKLKKKSKQKTSNSIFKGNRAYSLTEKIWKNVSLPIISSANNGNNNNKIGSGTSLLCNHRKQRQIEECIHCINELEERQPQQPQQLQHSNHHKSRRREQAGKSQRRKTVDSLFPLEENCYHHRDRHYSERDLLDHHHHVEGQARGGRLIALKKLSRSSNSIITGTTNEHRQKQNKNVNGFLYDLNKHTFSNTNDVIGGLSSSSLSSSYTTQAAVSVHHQPHQRVVKKGKKQQRKRCVGVSSASADCLNTLTSTDSSEEEDVGDNGRRTATTIAAHSIKGGVRVQDKRKSFSCDDFISRVDDDYDYDQEIVNGKKGQGQLNVKVKGGDISKRKEKGTANNNNKAAGEQRRKHLSYSNSSSNRNHNSFGAGKLSSSIINECKNDNDDDGIQVKSYSRRQDTKEVHLSKLKKRKSGGVVPKVVTVEMNPIIIAEEGKGEDSSESSAISSLPTSSSSLHHHQNCDHDHQDDKNDVGVKQEKKNKNRVKWTFLTSGLAKATRKLSSGSSRSSLSSFTTCNSDSGASSHSSFKKESSENTSTSSSCASSGIEVGRKKGKNKNSTSIIKTAVVKNEVANDDIIFSGKVKSSTKKVEDTKRRNTAEVFFNETTGEASISTSNVPSSNMFRRPQKILPPSQQRSKTTLINPVTANRTASLRRRPSYNAKKQRPIATAAVFSGIRKKPLSLGQADIISSTTLQTGPSVFLRKPLRFPHLTRVVSAPVGSSTAVNHTSIFSAFSNSSRNSSTSSSSTSGYTSNVTRQTSKFLKSFRKRWAKKNNKVADGDEEKAAIQLTKREDEDEDDNDCNGENDGNDNGNNHSHYTSHQQHDKVETSPIKKTTTSMNAFSGTINRLSLTRKKRRNTSRASKQAIFSTFYIGPAITDPMEEEKIYVTKDFDDVTLDLQSGEVKKTCDGTLLFKADPLCFADKNKLKKKSKKLKLKMEKQIIMKKMEEDEKKRVMISRASKVDEMPQQQKGGSSKERKDEKNNGRSRASGGSGEQMEFNKKNNYVISHAHVRQQQSVEKGKEDEQDFDETVVISRRNGGNANSANNNSKSHEGKYFSKMGIMSKNRKSEGKVKISSGNSAGALMTMTKNTSGEATTNSSGKSRRVSGSGLIKSYLGISKDLHTGVMRGANRKNQSADDITGSGGGPGDDNAPDTPTRGSSGILGRLRDSSRSGFGFSSSGSGGGSRSSSKKRSSSKHDTVNTTGASGYDVTDSPSATQRNSLSESGGARGNTDDANDHQEGVSGKLSTGQHHRSCSSEEELTSINSCDNRLSSLTLVGGSDGGGEGEYNGPFQGRAVALVDCTPSPYDRHALRYKKGDEIDIISKKPTGLWTGKVNNQIGSFKFMNVKLLPNPSSSSLETYDMVESNQRRVGGGGEDDDEYEEEDDVIDGDDSAGDYADTSNYQCSLHYNGRGAGIPAAAGVGEECCCAPPPSSQRRRTDLQKQHHQSPGAHGKTQYQGNPKRLAGADLTPWDLAAEQQRQSVANVINGYGIGNSNKDKRSKERGMYHGDPLGIMNAEEDDDEDRNEEGEDVQNEEDDEDLEESEDDDDDDVEEGDESLEADNVDGMLNQNQLDSADKDVKCQERKSHKSKRSNSKATASTKKNTDITNNQSENDGSGNVKARMSTKQGTSYRKGRPKTVGDLLQRINLEHYTIELEKHGFESLDLLKELEEEDLDTIGISDGGDRTKLLTAVELLREWDTDSERIPGQTFYQYQYYLTTQRVPKSEQAIMAGDVVQQNVGLNTSNMSKIMDQQQQQQLGSPAQPTQQGLQTSGNTGMPSPHFYRLHHPRDSGIFVGKVDGEEDGDEPISGADLSCAESHPDAETEEIILSPINLQKTSSSSVVGGGAAQGNPGAAWHSNHHHHNNNNKQGSHHHINRFISKGAPAGIISSSNNVVTSAPSTAGSAVQIAQQPTSSASSSGSSSTSSGIATTGDSFWNSVSSSNNSNGSGGSSSSSGGSGPATSSIVVDQNHSQWTKQQQQTRDVPPPSSTTAGTHHHRKRDSSPAYNSDSVRIRFQQAKSLFETSNNCSGGGGAASGTSVGGKPVRAPGHVYENGGAVLEETVSGSSGAVEPQPHHLHLQRIGSQGKPLSQQQQNRFLYCEKSSDSGISVCTNSPPPLRNEFRN